MPIVRTSSGTAFCVEPDEPILDAAERAGLRWEYSCRTGRCSTCRVRVAEGASRALTAEYGLSPEEREAGWVLSCARTASSDLLLSSDPDLGDVVLPVPRTIPARINAVERLASDVLLVTLRMPPTADFDYRAGQHLEVIGPDGVRRSYSMANSRRVDGTIDLHIRAVPGGLMSAYWFERARPDDLLRVRGPLGTFFLRDTPEFDLVFLATGTGIAPVNAMLQSLDRELHPAGITVYFGGRRVEDFYLRDPAQPMIRVLSRDDGTWSGPRGYVQHALLADGPNLARSAVYACGSELMINDARELLVERGLDPRLFFADAFVSSQPPQWRG